MDFTLDSTEKIISISIAGLGAVAFILRKLILPKFRKMKEHFLRIREMMGKVNHIYTELTPNGGGSIKDVVGRIKSEISEVHDLSIANNLKTMLLFSASPEALFECNLKGQTVWANESLENLFGMTKEEMLGDGWMSAIFPDDMDNVFKMWEECIKTLRPYRVRYRIINAETGEIIRVEATAQVLRNNKFLPISFWGKVIRIDESNLV